MADWAKDKKAVWEKVCDKYGGSKEAFDWGTWGFFDWSIGKAWPTIMSVSKARKFGWNRYDDTFETWVETFKTFANAGVLPSKHMIEALSQVEALSNGTSPAQINGNINGTNEKLSNHANPEEKVSSTVAS